MPTQTNNEICCQKKCITQILQSLNGSASFYSAMELFIKDIFLLKTNRRVEKFSKFYSFLIQQGIILCEVGLFNIEKYLFESIYTFLFHSNETEKNTFVNNKMTLYSWIEPEFLEININHANTEEIYLIYEDYEYFYSKVECAMSELMKLKLYKTPTQKKNTIINVIIMVYAITGKNSCHDRIFPVLVYILITSQFTDLYHHFYFMKIFDRSKYHKCKVRCIHLVHVEDSEVCICFPKENISINECDYYLTMFEAALVFIKRIEFSDLNVSRIIFDLELKKRIGLIDCKKPEALSKKEKHRIYSKTKKKIFKLFGINN